MAKIRIYAVDGAKLGLQVADSSDEGLMQIVRGIPTRTYRSQYRHWEISLSDDNIKYLVENFPEGPLAEIDDDAKLMMRYVSARDRAAARKAERRWEYVFDGKVPPIPYEPYTKGFNHQVVCLDAMHGSEFFGVFMEMGTGKTWAALNEIRWAARDKALSVPKGSPIPSYKVLISCPNGLTHTWKKEMAKHWPPRGKGEGELDYEVWVLGLMPWSVDQMIEFARSKAKIKVLVCGLDRLNSGDPEAGTMTDALTKFKFDLFLIDESARIKNPHSKRSRACQEIADKSANRRIIMTGSPVVNNILDLYSQFQFLSPGCLGFDSYYGFTAHHTLQEKNKGHTRIIEFRNMDELKAKMAKYSFVVKKADCLDLPPKTYETRVIPMGAQQRKMYDQMLEWFMASLTDEATDSDSTTAKAAIAQLTRLRQICGGFIKTGEGVEKIIPDATGKSDQLLEDLEDTAGKVIVWRTFVKETEIIRQTLLKGGYKWVELVGSTPEDKRGPAEEMFNNDENIKVLIADAGLAGEGRTLLGTPNMRCATSIFWSSDYSLGKRLQAEDRNHRIGQDSEKVLYLDYVCEDSIEERIALLINRKKDLAAMLTDVKAIRNLLLNPLEMF